MVVLWRDDEEGVCPGGDVRIARILAFRIIAVTGKLEIDRIDEDDVHASLSGREIRHIACRFDRFTLYTCRTSQYGQSYGYLFLHILTIAQPSHQRQIACFVAGQFIFTGFQQVQAFDARHAGLADIALHAADDIGRAEQE